MAAVMNQVAGMDEGSSIHDLENMTQLITENRVSMVSSFIFQYHSKALQTPANYKTQFSTFSDIVLFILPQGLREMLQISRGSFNSLQQNDQQGELNTASVEGDNKTEESLDVVARDSESSLMSFDELLNMVSQSH